MMKVGIVVYSGDSEAVWNAFRFGNFTLAMGDEARAFLLGKGVEFQSLDTDTFRVGEQVQTFLGSGGKIFACGVCLQIHRIPDSEIFTVSSMKDLYEIVRDCDRVVSF